VSGLNQAWNYCGDFDKAPLEIRHAWQVQQTAGINRLSENTSAASYVINELECVASFTLSTLYPGFLNDDILATKAQFATRLPKFDWLNV